MIKCPLPYSTDEFDSVCFSTLLYVEPKPGLLEEYVRITRPGGLICCSICTDNLDEWEDAKIDLDRKLSWRLADEPYGPFPYLPPNQEYGDAIQVVVLLYEVCLKV